MNSGHFFAAPQRGPVEKVRMANAGWLCTRFQKLIGKPHRQKSK
jgi:hypothetical protein